MAHTLGLLALGLATVGLIGCGLIGFGRAHPVGWDLVYFRVAGEVWAEGQSPYNDAAYDARILRDSPKPEPDAFFAYPPNIAPFALMVAAWGEAWEWHWLTLLNILATLGVAWELARWLRSRDGRGDFWATLGPWVVAAAVLGCPYTWDAYWLGQPFPLLLWALVAGWRRVADGRPWLGGALLGLALVKPPIVALPLVWLLLKRQWRAIGAAAVVSLALVAYPVWLHGPIAPVSGWLAELQAYQTAPYNQYGSDDLFGLWSFVAALGAPTVSPKLLLVILAGVTALIWWRRTPRDELASLGWLAGACPALIYAHRYDMMLLLPAIAAAWPWLRGRPIAVATGALLLAAIALPERLVLAVDWLPPLALHYRSLAMPLLMLGYLALMLTPARLDQQASAPRTNEPAGAQSATTTHVPGTTTLAAEPPDGRQQPVQTS
jgi:hypothetical protein